MVCADLVSDLPVDFDDERGAFDIGTLGGILREIRAKGSRHFQVVLGTPAYLGASWSAAGERALSEADPGRHQKSEKETNRNS